MAASPKLPDPIRYIDLFCGIGGFRVAAEQVTKEFRLQSSCVFSSDIDEDAKTSYAANFGHIPTGDITKVAGNEVPDHDLLLGGFPCQAFSIIGERKGFEDTRGTLFFDVARILDSKRPKAFVLENVKQLSTHDGGRTLARILHTLDELGYHTDYKVLNALNYGVPQKRERIFFVGFREPRDFSWPAPAEHMKPLQDILETKVDDFYYASDRIKKQRLLQRAGKDSHTEPTIWHENKAGNVSAYPYSCAMRAGASYNYLLVNGERRLTEREMLRLQGFPDSYKVVVGYGAARKQAGNSVAVPCVAAVLRSVFKALQSKPILSAPMKYRPFSQQDFSFQEGGQGA
jgi:DNA (cytosine-5)-methyltransferase 1